MQAQMLAEMTQFFAKFARNNARVDTGARPRPEAVYERYMRMDPKEFSGITDPMIAEVWIKSIEVIFTFIELQDADRVRCATFLLTGDARLWWESASVTVNLQTLSWNGFNEVFYSKYFTKKVRSRLTKEFMTLRQGDSSVAEFVRKFERGFYFVPLITNDARKKLRAGLEGYREWQAGKEALPGTSAAAAVQEAFPGTAGKEAVSRTAKKQTSYAAKECSSEAWTARSGGSRPRGRVFAMHAEEVNPDTTLLTEKARRLMHKGCQVFLASIISTPDTPVPSISDVPVVRDFLDVFPDNVTGLPPEREVEFAIDLAPGIYPISKAPYRLAPAEMLELKQQIQELLDKELIRPSFSLWGTHQCSS
ncbi:uncharacterized protein [Primulina huaijiensis]|uniref:uncharacterized protein n=1 Tax=Primulina huaijiensis TaxID=1492673 RepID=UPI003CC78F9F